VDSRHGLKAVDRTVMSMLDGAAVNYQVVLTKADKPASKAVTSVREATRTALASHVAAHPDVLVTSSQTGAGLADLRAALGEIARPA
jgi:GTP-binding protein